MEIGSAEEAVNGSDAGGEDESLSTPEDGNESAKGSTAGLSTGDHGGAARRRIKRSRLTLSCMRCRAKKIKCDGTKPQCINCSDVGVACVLPQTDGRKTKARKVELKDKDPISNFSVAPSLPLPSTSIRSSIHATHNTDSDIAVHNTDSAAESNIQLLTRALGLPQHESGHHFAQQSSSHRNVEVPQQSSLLPPSDPHDATSQLPPSQTNLTMGPQHIFSWQLLNVPEHPGASGSTPSLPIQSSSNDRVLIPTLAPSVPNDNHLSLQYLRPFGPTAIQPGIEQISIAIRAPPSQSRSSSPQPGGSAMSSSQVSQSPLFTWNMPFVSANAANSSDGTSRSKVFDEESDVPKKEIQNELLPIFFTKMGSLFPFLTIEDVTREEDQGGDVSADMVRPLLLNTICALAARFSTSPLIRPAETKRTPATFGIPFADRAKQLLVPLLGYPSSRTVAAMLLMAYHEFGLNSEGALWMYSGMALRMAIDLGLNLAMPDTPNTQSRNRTFDKLVWWSCFLLDRTLAIGTGRPVTVKDSEITVSLPTDEDLFCLQSASHIPTGNPLPWPTCVRLFHLYGMIAEAVNIPSAIRRSQSEPPSRAEPNHGTARVASPDTAMTHVEDSITTLYNELPVTLIFTPENFRRHCEAGHGLPYVHIHLWYHAMIILLHRPPLLHPSISASGLSLTDRLVVVNNSCLAISHVLSSADLIDPYTYLASPFTNQAFFVAAKAWIQDYRIRTGRDVLAAGSSADTKTYKSSTNILAHVAQSNYTVCSSALNKQAKYWSGVGWIAAVVDKLGGQRHRMSLKAATEGVETYVSSQELAIFKRLLHRTTGSTTTPPEISDDVLSSIFSAFAPDTQNTLASVADFSEDDFAFAYSLAGSFPSHPFIS